MNKEQIARVCHEVNRAYCQALGDNSQPPWEVAADWMRTSAMNGVGLHVSNPDAGPEASHESWMKEKVDTGWKHGPVKNADKKEHPCMVAFSDLPVEQQAKDFIFRAVVHALSSTVDEELLQIVEDTANMLRGMTMDPSIPAHAKSAMRSRVTELEAAVESRS